MSSNIDDTSKFPKLTKYQKIDIKEIPIPCLVSREGSDCWDLVTSTKDGNLKSSCSEILFNGMDVEEAYLWGYCCLGSTTIHRLVKEVCNKK